MRRNGFREQLRPLLRRQMADVVELADLVVVKRSSLRRNEIPPELNRKFTQPGRLDWHAGLPPVTFAQIVIRPGRVPDLPSARAALQEVGPKERVMRDN